VQKHAAAFGEMRQYYNDVTSNNLELIASLKTEVNQMRHNDQSNYSLMNEINSQNKRLNEPLEKAQKEVESLRAQLSSLSKDQESLNLTRSRLRVVERHIGSLQEKHAKLLADYAELERKRDALLDSFDASLQEVAAVAQHRNRALQLRLAEIQGQSDQKDAQLGAVLQAANLDPAAVEEVTAQLETVLETKNRAIKDLHFELAKVAQTHCDVMKAYDRKAIAGGVPPLDLEAAGLVQTTIKAD